MLKLLCEKVFLLFILSVRVEKHSVNFHAKTFEREACFPYLSAAFTLFYDEYDNE